MLSVWKKFWGRCKSRLSAICRECYLSRAQWREKVNGLRTDLKALKSRVERLASANEQLKQTVKVLQSQLSVQTQLKNHEPRVESDRPKGCQYSAADVELAVNLTRCIGFRATVKAMTVMFNWLDIKKEIPTYQSIRMWMQRIGLDRTENATKIENATWLVDHTCQTGKEKVLTIMRVRPSNGLKANRPLKHSDLQLLAEVTRKSWTHADVLAIYKATCEEYGAPRAILADQASDLQQPAKALKNTYENVVSLVDFKHFLATRFKLILDGDADYASFTEKLKHSCACVQQTALSHFVPRPIKRKARFMNMGPILQWATTVLWHLEHPESRSCADVAPGQMTEKFGWLHDLKSKISQWQQCQAIIDVGVRLVDKQGLSQSTAEEFRQLAEPLACSAVAQQLIICSVEFLQTQAAQLKPNETLPMSTEIIESVFARYKALEKQHSKEGFSSLLLALGTLLRPVTEKEVLRSFNRIKCKDVKDWIAANLGRTYTSKRQEVFRECAAATSPSKKCAIAIAT